MEMLALEDLAGNTAESLRTHLVSDYEASLSEVDRFDILIAYESVGSWGCDSSSWFLLRERGTDRLFETFGSHCSCYGFEGQFEPEETSLDAIMKRPRPFYAGGYDNNEDDNVKRAIAHLNALAAREAGQP